MPDLQTIGRWLIVGGVLIAVLGTLIWLAGRFFKLQDLPGTIKIETSSLTCLIPLLASILISVVLTVVINVIIRGLNR